MVESQKESTTGSSTHQFSSQNQEQTVRHGDTATNEPNASIGDQVPPAEASEQLDSTSNPAVAIPPALGNVDPALGKIVSGMPMLDAQEPVSRVQIAIPATRPHSTPPYFSRHLIQ